MIKEYKPKFHREISQDKFQKIKGDIEKRFEVEHPFKPNLNYQSLFEPNIEKFPESKKEFFRRLASPKTIEINKRLQEKEIIDSQKFVTECTF
jgi:hypothetical protein